MFALASIDRAGASRRVAAWDLDDQGAATLTPAAILAAAAPVAAADGIDELTLDELTLATVINSEDGNAPPGTLCALADATLTRAGARSVYQAATAGKGFGRQGGGRPMSTAREPSLRHLRLAVALLRGELPRGYARGATQWLHWRTQDRMAVAKPAANCPARVVVERWCWACDWARKDARGNRIGCALGPHRRAALEWVGPVAGVDHNRLLLFRPATDAHAARWADVQRILAGGLNVAGVVLAAALLVAGKVFA